MLPPGGTDDHHWSTCDRSAEDNAGRGPEGVAPRRGRGPAAADAGALPIAHVDLTTLGVLEAPGNYGCEMAIGEGQSAGNPLSYGGPHYGFLAAKSAHIRRMIVCCW